MIANDRRGLRRVFMAALGVLLLFSTVGGQLPRASAQGLPKLPEGVDATAYLQALQTIKDEYYQCRVEAGKDKTAAKTCDTEAKAALKALIDQVKEDIKKAKGDHTHDEEQEGPPAPPEVPTEPVENVPNVPPSEPVPSEPIAGPRYHAKILVIAADGSEPQLGAIKQALDYMGSPYDVLVSATETLTADKLSEGETAKYSGVILTNGEAGYTDPLLGYTSGLTAEEWNTLYAFETAFKIRQVTWYTWPNPSYGLTYPEQTVVTGNGTTVSGTLTSAGRTLFSYLTLAPVVVDNAWTYLAKPFDANTTPLITTPEGYALASISKSADGRENLAMTFDTNEHLIHAHQVSYGVINWVTEGKFVGQKRVYLDAQVDDYFYPNDLWNPSDPNNMVSTYRMSGDDMKKLDAWQDTWRKGIAPSLKLSMAFNGEGTSGDAEYQPDTLTPTTPEIQSEFKWINHTWTHLNLNAATYAEAYEEIKLNLDLAPQLGLTDYSSKNLVTPEISGLFNPEAMRAAKDLGIKYTVSDTSRMGPQCVTACFPTPTANAATYNELEPSILMIPRRPTNLFYNVSTPSEWVSEYNHIHRNYWGKDLTYQEILDFESGVLLQYMMRGEIYPWMFHQANLRFYDGQRSLLTDLLDVTLNKYKAMFRLPILSPRMDQIASKIEERMALDSSNVEVIFNKGSSTLTLSASKTTVVPVTGVQYGNAVAKYGGQYTSYITVPGGQTMTISLN